jgi:hypothetical protein
MAAAMRVPGGDALGMSVIESDDDQRRVLVPLVVASEDQPITLRRPCGG